MSEVEKTLQEKNLAQEAYKRKEYDTSILHYSNAMRLNPKDMTFIYHVAKIHFEKKSYSESISFCSRAIKVGKEQKANVKMVAKAMAMRGRAHKGLGDMAKHREEVEKAVNFLKTIAQVKFQKERWEECMDFCMEARILAGENGLLDPVYWEPHPELDYLSDKAFQKYKQGPGPDTIKKQAKMLKTEIQMLSPDMDLKDITVEYNSDEKEFVVNINHNGGHGEARYKDVGMGRLVCQDGPNIE